MRRTSGVGSMVWWVGLTLALLLGPGGCSKSKPKKKKADRSLDHRAGIPVIPRGEIVLATAKGERYLLEIHARMPINQAVSFYRNQLQRENWTDLRFQQVSAGLWGLACRRGMFELTGRIKLLKQGVVSIGFERTVRKRTQGWLPPVRKDVPVLGTSVEWNDRIFEASGSRVEIRGRSARPPAVLHTALQAALRAQGWSVGASKGKQTVTASKSLTRQVTAEQQKAVTRELQGRGWTVKVDRDGRTLRAERRLAYHFEAVGKGSSIRLLLSYEEMKPRGAVATRRAASPDAKARPRPIPADDSNLVPLPKDLVLWPTPEPVLGVKQSDNLHSFSLTRQCSTPAKLLGEVAATLKKRGFRGLGAARRPKVALGGRTMHSTTLTKGNRAVVVIVTRDVDTCTVQLTVVHQK